MFQQDKWMMHNKSSQICLTSFICISVLLKKRSQNMKLTCQTLFGQFTAKRFSNLFVSEQSDSKWVIRKPDWFCSISLIQIKSFLLFHFNRPFMNCAHIEHVFSLAFKLSMKLREFFECIFISVWQCTSNWAKENINLDWSVGSCVFDTLKILCKLWNSVFGNWKVFSWKSCKSRNWRLTWIFV